MLIGMRVTRKYNAPSSGDEIALLAPEYGDLVPIKTKYSRIPLVESGLYLIDVQAKQKDGKAFLGYTVIAQLNK